jgi:hypothetical protein
MLLMLKQFSFSPTVVLCAFQWFLFMFHQVKMLLQYDEVWLSDLLATYSGVMHVVVSGFWYVVVCLVLCVLVPGQSLVGMSSNFDRVDNSWQLKFGSENGFFFFFLCWWWSNLWFFFSKFFSNQLSSCFMYFYGKCLLPRDQPITSNDEYILVVG